MTPKKDAQSFDQPVFTLRRYYTRHLARNIWRALRSEKMNFMQGRNVFADYIFHTIQLKTKNVKIEYEDGELFHPPKKSISDKTISNFMDLSSNIFEIETSSVSASLKTAQITFQYLHLFLWCVDESRVSQWKDRPATRIDQKIVNNIDDNFELFKATNVFPKAIKLYAFNENLQPFCGISDTSRKFDKDGNPYPIDLEKEEHCTLIAVVMFQEIENSIYDECTLIERYEWKDTLEKFGKRNSSMVEFRSFFNILATWKKGKSLTFRSKNFDHPYEGKMSISTNEFVTAIALESDFFDNNDHLTRYSLKFPLSDKRINDLKQGQTRFEENLYHEIIFRGALGDYFEEGYANRVAIQYMNDDECYIINTICNYLR